MMATPNGIVRATGLLVIEVRNSNPNGDPDQEGEPRRRLHDGRGIIAGVSFKRKVRDLVEWKDGPVWDAVVQELNLESDNGTEFDILESRGRDRAQIEKETKSGTFSNRYWDARVFGATFLEKGGEWIRSGVVQFANGISVAPVRVERMTNTNKAGVQEGKDRGMAPLAYRVVEHGVYCMPFFVNPTAAKRTGCTPRDIELLLRLIPLAYPHTASHIRPSVEVRHAWYVTHPSPLGSCSDFAIVDALTPRKRTDPEVPSVSWDDYDVPQGLDAESALGKLVCCRDLSQGNGHVAGA